jgi:hypothetical protein
MTNIPGKFIVQFSKCVKEFISFFFSWNPTFYYHDKIPP